MGYGSTRLHPPKYSTRSWTVSQGLSLAGGAPRSWSWVPWGTFRWCSSWRRSLGLDLKFCSLSRNRGCPRGLLSLPQLRILQRHACDMIRNMEEIKIMPGGQWDWSWEDVPTSRAKVKSSHVGPRVLVTQGWLVHQPLGKCLWVRY